MVRSQWQARSFVALLPFIAACSSTLGGPASKVTQAPRTSAAAVVDAQVAGPRLPAEDPVVSLIAASDRHFEAGEKELGQGHFEAAKQEFNQAINVLLESPFGGRTEPRIRERFDWLVDRISAYEIKALAQGDGFTEKSYEPASIDDLLALSTTFGAPVPGPALQDTVQSDLENVLHDVPIPLNRKVLSYIELFQGRLHDFIQDGLTRGAKYLPMIQNVFRAEGLPLDLAYVPLIESAFKPNALSRAKAQGVWQFMSGTARENGLQRDWYIDERSDPEKSTLAAAKYLRTLNETFDGDWHLALASYNGGPGRVQKALKRTRANDFWMLTEKPRILPRETREYVPMILAAMVIARNPAQYGFAFEPTPPQAFEKVTLPRAVDLRRIAEWTDTSIDEIRALNPELRRWTTPVKSEAYELKVPVGKAESVISRLADAAAEDLASLNWYTAKKGDTLATIAKKLRVSRTDLAEANYLRTTARVKIGDKLIVPREATVLMAARTDRPVPVAEARPTVTESGQLAADANSNRVKVTYQVKRGDTLASLARLFKTTVASIQEWNPRLSEPRRLMAGARITVYKLED
jgi:membrane-bound lytic murein transglycosylase D